MAVARSSFGYILPFSGRRHVSYYGASAGMSLPHQRDCKRRVPANTPTAWYWLHFVSDYGRCQDSSSPSCKSCWGGVYNAPFPCYSTPDKRVESMMSVTVCLSSACISHKSHVKPLLHQIFYACAYLWPWFDRPLVALQCDMYFRFCG